MAPPKNEQINPYAPYSQGAIEAVAISLYYQALENGTETTSPADDTVKQKYRDLAFKLMPTIPGTDRATNYGKFVIVGSQIPNRSIPEYTPADYADYPALDPTK